MNKSRCSIHDSTKTLLSKIPTWSPSLHNVLGHHPWGFWRAPEKDTWRYWCLAQRHTLQQLGVVFVDQPVHDIHTTRYKSSSALSRVIRQIKAPVSGIHTTRYKSSYTPTRVVKPHIYVKKVHIAIRNTTSQYKHVLGEYTRKKSPFNQTSKDYNLLLPPYRLFPTVHLKTDKHNTF